MTLKLINKGVFEHFLCLYRVYFFLCFRQYFHLFKTTKLCAYIRCKRINIYRFLLMQVSKNKDELKVITVDELKQYDGLNDLSNDEASHIIESLKQLALLSHNIVSKYEQPKPIPKLRKA